MAAPQESRQTMHTSFEAQLKLLSHGPIFNYTHQNDILEKLLISPQTIESANNKTHCKVAWAKLQRNRLTELLVDKSRSLVENFLKKHFSRQSPTPVDTRSKQSFVFTVASRFLDQPSPKANAPGKSRFCTETVTTRLQKKAHSKEIETRARANWQAQHSTLGDDRRTSKRSAENSLIQLTSSERHSRRGSDSRKHSNSPNLIRKSLNRSNFPNMFLLSGKENFGAQAGPTRKAGRGRKKPKSPGPDSRQLAESTANLSLSRANLARSKWLVDAAGESPTGACREKLFMAWLTFEREHLSRADLCAVTKGLLSREFIRQVNWRGQKIMLEHYEARQSRHIRSQACADKQMALLQQKAEFAELQKNELQEQLGLLKKRQQNLHAQAEQKGLELRRLRAENRQLADLSKRQGRELADRQAQQDKWRRQLEALRDELAGARKKLEDQKQEAQKLSVLREETVRLQQEKAGLAAKLESRRKEFETVHSQFKSKIADLERSQARQVQHNQQLKDEQRRHRQDNKAKLRRLKAELEKVISEKAHLVGEIEQAKQRAHRMQRAHAETKAVMRNFRKGFHYYRQKSNKRDQQRGRDPSFITEHSRDNHGDRGSLGRRTCCEKPLTSPNANRELVKHVQMQAGLQSSKGQRMKHHLIHDKGLKLSSLFGLDGLRNGRKRADFLNKLKATPTVSRVRSGCLESVVDLGQDSRRDIRQENVLPDDNAQEHSHMRKLLQSKSAELLVMRSPLNPKAKGLARVSQDTEVSRRESMVKTDSCTNHWFRRKTSQIAKSKSPEVYLTASLSRWDQSPGTLEDNPKHVTSNRVQLMRYTENYDDSFCGQNLTDRGNPKILKKLAPDKGRFTGDKLKADVLPKCSIQDFSLKCTRKKFAQGFKPIDRYSVHSGSRSARARNPIYEINKRIYQIPEKCDFSKHKKFPSQNHRPPQSKKKEHQFQAKGNSNQAVRLPNKRLRRGMHPAGSRQPAHISHKRRSLLRLVNTNQRRFIKRMSKKYSLELSGEINVSRDKWKFSKRYCRKPHSFNIKFELA